VTRRTAQPTPGAAPERPTRLALSRDHVLRTALALIDAEGVPRLSMRRLGAALGVDPMAVYHWVPNKGALLDGVTELIWRDMGLGTADPQDDWRAVAADVARGLRTTLRKHPNAVVVVGTHPISGPTMLAIFDAALGVLAAAGLPPASAIDLLYCLTTFTVGHVLAEAVDPVGGADEPAAPVDLAALVDAYPHLGEAISHGWEFDAEAQWETGLTALLAGWPTTPR